MVGRFLGTQVIGRAQRSVVGYSLRGWWVREWRIRFRVRGWKSEVGGLEVGGSDYTVTAVGLEQNSPLHFGSL